MNEGIQQYGRSYLSFLVQELSVKLLHLGGVHFPYKTIRDFLLGCSVIRNYREVSQHKSTIETVMNSAPGFWMQPHPHGLLRATLSIWLVRCVGARGIVSMTETGRAARFPALSRKP